MLIVAEIGLNHDGRWDRAYELIRQAQLCGADIAKFQFGWRKDPGEINHITPAIAVRLKEWCEHFGIEFMASIISDDSLALAKEVRPRRYKIASRTVIDNPALVERVLSEAQETFISLGWWIREGRTGWPFGPPNDHVRYIYCQSSYPTYPSQLRELPAVFSDQGYYGFSDHTIGTEACLLAIARGARFVEKHFTLDKTIVSVHNDHILSADPAELRDIHVHGRALGRLAAVMDGRATGAQPVG